ncbi:hypothetical protein [Rhizobiales bacterium]|uniref:hypothetical protein n=1 Tax=Agrobacterium radiobacter TaxID=362 RepID=UPI000DCF73B5
MGRTAEYSIKGYVYQFLRYLSEIIAAGEGTTITIEGAIEDIDVHASSITTAVQCKYHEQSEKFTLGKIYKPILLMLEHFSAHYTSVPTVHYRLFCHFPNESGTRSLTREELDLVLSTTADALVKIVNRVDRSADYDLFLSRLTIEFGQSAEELQKTVLASLKAKGFSPDDIDAIIFPTAIQRIVDLATKSTISDRTVDPAAFLASLRDAKHVAFTRWTRELATREQIFKRLRKELKSNLNRNSRRRHFVIDPTNIDNFDKDIVRFIRKFTENYSSKFLHNNPPLFAISGDYDVGALVTRVHDAGLRCADGFIGTSFRAEELLRKPILREKPFAIEFNVRLAKRDTITGPLSVRPDELFLVNVAEDPWMHADVNVHQFEIERLSDLEYALQLRSDYA